jgi:hypothetical protein
MTHLDGPFATAASELAGFGLAIIPVGGDDGKRPLVRWPRRPLGPNSKALVIWAKKFSDANIGVLAKPSNVTVVDVDDRSLAKDMERRFGATPLITRTPSGGLHFWYKANGETCRNLRQSESLPVDVKAGGDRAGGFVVVPPSLRPSGEHAGKHYSFELGGWRDLARLPSIRPGSLVHARTPVSLRAAVGERNQTLFRALKATARQSISFQDLEFEAGTLNREYAEPLADSEVARILKSVWRYREQNQLWHAGTSRSIVTKDDLVSFGGKADAFLLYHHLLCAHATRAEPFAVSDKAMTEAGVIAGWRRDRYRSARDVLISLGRMRRVHHGGSGPKDPSLYAFRFGD